MLRTFGKRSYIIAQILLLTRDGSIALFYTMLGSITDFTLADPSVGGSTSRWLILIVLPYLLQFWHSGKFLLKKSGVPC